MLYVCIHGTSLAKIRAAQRAFVIIFMGSYANKMIIIIVRLGVPLFARRHIHKRPYYTMEMRATYSPLRLAMPTSSDQKQRK